MIATKFYNIRGAVVTLPTVFKHKITQRVLLALLLLGYFSLVLWLFPRLGIHCVFLSCFGIPCPGCGMTRAAFSLLRLDLAAAWRYNPLIFAMPYVLAYLFFDLRPPRVHRRILLAIGVAALIHWAFVLLQH